MGWGLDMKKLYGTAVAVVVALFLASAEDASA